MSNRRSMPTWAVILICFLCVALLLGVFANLSGITDKIKDFIKDDETETEVEDTGTGTGTDTGTDTEEAEDTVFTVTTAQTYYYPDVELYYYGVICEDLKSETKYFVEYSYELTGEGINLLTDYELMQYEDMDDSGNEFYFIVNCAVAEGVVTSTAMVSFDYDGTRQTDSVVVTTPEETSDLFIAFTHSGTEYKGIFESITVTFTECVSDVETAGTAKYLTHNTDADMYGFTIDGLVPGKYRVYYNFSRFDSTVITEIANNYYDEDDYGNVGDLVLIDNDYNVNGDDNATIAAYLDSYTNNSEGIEFTVVNEYDTVAVFYASLNDVDIASCSYQSYFETLILPGLVIIPVVE